MWVELWLNVMVDLQGATITRVGDEGRVRLLDGSSWTISLWQYEKLRELLQPTDILGVK